MSKSYKENKVSVQKGPVNAAEMTMKQMSHKQCASERYEQLDMLKDGQTLKYNEPKK